MAKNIFIIEDDENIRSLLRVALNSYGFQAYAFEMAEDAFDMLRDVRPDLCVFDIMLPGMDGIEAVEKLRRIEEYQTLPVMMLTAKDTEADKVIGLDSGADDYMTKPFGVMELMARIRALLRREERARTAAGTGEVPGDLTLGSLRICHSTREVLLDDTPVPLTYKEYEILSYLARYREQVVSREQLLKDLWGYDFDVETRTLDMHIRSLRQKLGDDGTTFIKTVRGVGYRFCGREGTETE